MVWHVSVDVFYKHAVCRQGLCVTCLLCSCRGSCSWRQKACQGGTWMDWQLEGQTVKEANAMWCCVSVVMHHQLQRKCAVLTLAEKFRWRSTPIPLGLPLVSGWSVLASSILQLSFTSWLFTSYCHAQHFCGLCFVLVIYMLSGPKGYDPKMWTHQCWTQVIVTVWTDFAQRNACLYKVVDDVSNFLYTHIYRIHMLHLSWGTDVHGWWRLLQARLLCAHTVKSGTSLGVESWKVCSSIWLQMTSVL